MATLKTSFALRLAYCLALLTLAFPTLFFGSSRWLSLELHTGLLSLPGLMIAAAVVAFYRIYIVAHYPAALDVTSHNGLQSLLRVIGIAGMVMGIAASVGMFCIPAIMAFLHLPTVMRVMYEFDFNLSNFSLSVYLLFGSSLGWLGCAFFEFSRIGSKPGVHGEVRKTSLRNPVNAAMVIFIVALLLAYLALMPKLN